LCAYDISNSIRMTMDFTDLSTNRWSSWNRERAYKRSQPADVIRELVQSVGLAGLTRESTKSQSTAIDAYKKPEHDGRVKGFHLTLQWSAYILFGMLVARKNSKRRSPRLRDPERTRERVLQAAFREVYKSGFQSASLDAILAGAGVTKGALYHHFKSKEALGYAIVEEVVEEITRDRWVRPLRRSKDKDAIDALIGIVRAIPAQPKDVKGGCPLVNLAQEMSPLDEQFRERLERIFHAWQDEIAAAVRSAQSQGTVRRDLVPEEIASFLVALVEGYEVLAKNAQDSKVWNMGIRNIVGWLRSLRPPGNRKRG
jgi:TetR/AcrR family transcriptional repressor of nem operon